jgi:hypothetical protein
MPVSFAQKWAIPAIRMRKALKVCEDENSPGGIEAAMLFSIFDLSVLDFNKSSAIRALVAYAKDDTVKLIQSSCGALGTSIAGRRPRK